MAVDRKYDLEKRLIEFAISIVKLVEKNGKNYALNHLSQQIIRSSTSPPLMYGEAQGAESQKDFIHKMSIGLKELRETQINLKIMKGLKVDESDSELDSCLKECSELVAIFTSSIKTARRGLKKY